MMKYEQPQVASIGNEPNAAIAVAVIGSVVGSVAGSVAGAVVTKIME